MNLALLNNSGKKKRPSFLYETIHLAFHVKQSLPFKITEAIIWFFIIASSVIFAVDLILFDGHSPFWLKQIDRVILWIFAAELILRVLSYRPKSEKLFKKSSLHNIKTVIYDRLLFMIAPMQILDLLVVLTLFPILRGLRILRLFKLLRGIKLFKYSNPILEIIRTFKDNALLYVLIIFTLAIIVSVLGTAFYLIEVKHNPGIKTIGDGIWWAVVTITTVGYGDITPVVQPLGRMLGVVLMLLGMFTLALFAGIVSSTFLRVLFKLRKDQFRMSNYTNHIVICGWDPSVLLLLDALLQEVDPSKTEIVVFGKGERPGALAPQFIWVSGNPVLESELDKVRLSFAKTAIIIGSRDTEPAMADAATIMTLFTMKSFVAKESYYEKRETPLYIVAEILDPQNVAHAKTAGADEVIETTRLGFAMMAHAATFPGSGKIMTGVATAGAHSLYISKNPENTMNFEELYDLLHKKHKIILLGIKDNTTKEIDMDPSHEAIVKNTMDIVYLAKQPLE